MSSKFLIGTALVVGIYSCKSEDAPQPGKCYEDVTGFDLLTDTTLVFPFGTRNFWIYDDSLKRDDDTAIRLVNNNFLLTAQQLFLIDKKYSSISFNQWLPQLTLINDTVYLSKFSEGTNESNCFEHTPFLFKTEQIAYLDTENAIELHPSIGSIPTRLGDLEYQYIYKSGESSVYFVNTKIGIVRAEIRTATGEVVRSKTLNNYYIE